MAKDTLNKAVVDKKEEDDLINETMLVNLSVIKGTIVFLKERLKYLFIKNKVGELGPNVYMGYTDHPLDIDGTPFITPFAFFKKLKKRAACSVLQVELKEQSNASFTFLAKGFNIFKIINYDVMFKHEYVIDKSTKYTEMTLKIDFLRNDVYRMRLAKGASVPENKTPMIDKDISDPKLKTKFKEENDRYTISTSKLRIEIYKENFRIEVFDSKGNLITESGSQTKNDFPVPFDAFPLGFITLKKRQQYGVDSFVLYPGEAVYGLGEHFGPVNHVGKTIGQWIIEGLGNTSGRVYKNVPFFMSTQGYGVFINESRPITFWVGSRETCKNMFAVEGDLIDYFFFYGPSFKNILNNYTELTGKPAILPKWSFGTWISRISYFSQKQVMGVVKRLREMKFPSDVIHIDTGWFDVDWRCDWKFSAERFPDPATMFKEAEDMGFKICLWQIPYVLRDTDAYKDAKRTGALAKNKGPFVFLFQFAATPIDFSNPEGVSWYKNKLRNLLKMGASSIKTDFGEGIEPPMRFKEYDGRQMHNLFPLLYQKAAFEITEETHGKGEAVIWARGGYAGCQRYPVHWAGDNSSNYENLLSSLRGGISMGLCGFTYWSQDTGGFVGVPSDEVYIRWTQLSIFQSHIRFHGQPPHYKEPWNFLPKTQEIVRDYLELRYRLIAYLYSEAQVAIGGGLPMLRHLVIDFQDDPTVYNIEDQFMCGRNILVAPILTKNNVRSVYLPEGFWYDFWSGERLKGKQWINLKVGLKTIPVYVREGTALPLLKVAQSTDDLSYDNMTIQIYPDEEGKASYDILDKDKHFEITASVEKTAAKITVTPEPEGIMVKLPKSFKISNIKLNSRKV